ncbi:MAG: NADH-quinone oxidoreductase subunit NuoE [Fibrobacter sp.]|nr:NADH-quinone oxidoreductase subunit NuoE [Fibrobacter sp.]
MEEKTTIPECAGDCSTRKFEAVCAILKKYNHNPENLIPILQEIQEQYRYLPAEVMTFVANALDVNPARVYGVATFYAHFALEPKGKYVIRICDGTACHVKGSMEIYNALKRRLGIKGDSTTTPDMLFTLETVSCLGACGLAPAMVINDDVHGQMNGERAVALIDSILQTEAKGQANGN